ncbi:hypothetical protein GCM10008090_17390 [Arenicella chitinivorans]|uniref:Uncharacterized protein n=1 Tax=Arenicella chitinivorans TaxID=1329800 RepID=A0A918RR78_9GAMM|nr:hypothetical protein [Arenicella chitinivorans]GHA08084.1 hypothetical protein GCM10008090_17390 [Arenicella chitinivorans]
MTIAAAYLSAVKQHPWLVHHVERGRKVSAGDAFTVIGDKQDIDAVVVRGEKGDNKLELVPIEGTVKIEATQCDELTLSFKYKSNAGSIDKLLLRFHFFKADRTVFRFKLIPNADERDCEDKCECCCCGSQGTYILYSTYEDGDEGSGGPHDR